MPSFAVCIRVFRSTCLILGLLATPAVVLAQKATNVAPGECTNCHDHDAQKEWSISRDGDGKGKQHFKAYQQLFEPKGLEWGEALGVKVNDVKGPCVTCHATVVQGKAKNGVTCQTCHGPGSLYLKPHQVKGDEAYRESVGLGLKDTIKKPNTWVRDCMTCHVLGNNPDDARIAKAGHPDGSDFVIGTRLQFVQGPGHWKSTYSGNDINAIAEPIKRVLLGRLKGASGGGTTTTAKTEPAPEAPKTETAKSEPAKVDPPKVDTARVETSKPEPPKAPPTKEELIAPPPPPPPPVRTTRAAVPPPPPPDPVVTPPAPDAPMTPAPMIGSIQGRLAALLDTLLVRGVVLPKPVTPPTKQTLYRGADAELIRLQDEIISLALEALASPPKPRSQQ
jgi:hypothetical protein